MGTLKRRIIEDMEPTEYELARRWIPVEERLPKDGPTNTVLLSDGEWVTIGYRRELEWYVVEAAEALGYAAFDRLPFWMPLPEPPEVK